MGGQSAACANSSTSLSSTSLANDRLHMCGQTDAHIRTHLVTSSWAETKRGTLASRQPGKRQLIRQPPIMEYPWGGGLDVRNVRDNKWHPRIFQPWLILPTRQRRPANRTASSGPVAIPTATSAGWGGVAGGLIGQAKIPTTKCRPCSDQKEG